MMKDKIKSIQWGKRKKNIAFEILSMFSSSLFFHLSPFLFHCLFIWWLKILFFVKVFVKISTDRTFSQREKEKGKSLPLLLLYSILSIFFLIFFIAIVTLKRGISVIGKLKRKEKNHRFSLHFHLLRKTSTNLHWNGKEVFSFFFLSKTMDRSNSFSR